MIIVISDSDFRSDEAMIVNKLFKSGLDLFHIRKYGASEEALLKLVESIDAKYYTRLVLHHDHEWGKSIGLNRFHFSEKDRKYWKEMGWNRSVENTVYSTSVHSFEEYNELSNHFSYAFLSPVFDSISKSDYKAEKFDFSKKENKAIKLIGLGGIQSHNVLQAMQMGFDGVALLGAIWHNSDPINEWNHCWDVMHHLPNVNSSFPPLEPASSADRGD